jgi:hypothetical protein
VKIGVTPGVLAQRDAPKLTAEAIVRNLTITVWVATRYLNSLMVVSVGLAQAI